MKPKRAPDLPPGVARSRVPAQLRAKEQHFADMATGPKAFEAPLSLACTAAVRVILYSLLLVEHAGVRLQGRLARFQCHGLTKDKKGSSWWVVVRVCPGGADALGVAV